MPHQQRIEALRRLIEKEGCQALLVEDTTNLYYLTGQELSSGRFVVDVEGGANLLVDGRYFEACKQKAPIPVFRAETTSLEETFSQKPFRWIRSCAFDSTRTTHKTFQQMQSIGKQLNIAFVPVDDPISELRMIKDPSEIKALAEAAALGSSGYDHILQLLKEGITEEEVAQELEIFWKRRGSKGVAFDPIIAFGPNSSMPHYRAGKTPLKRGDIVLIDIGVNFHHYHSDMTRAIFFGEPNPRLVDIYQIVKEAQEKALALCKPGALLGDLDTIAREHIVAHGFGDFFTHSLGHGVGLDIHEAPWVRSRPPHNHRPLEENMVITIEPGIYLPEIGGVRIEDCIAITQKGNDNLTNRAKEITVI